LAFLTNDFSTGCRCSYAIVVSAPLLAASFLALSFVVVDDLLPSMGGWVDISFSLYPLRGKKISYAIYAFFRTFMWAKREPNGWNEGSFSRIRGHQRADTRIARARFCSEDHCRSRFSSLRSVRRGLAIPIIGPGQFLR